MCAIAQCERAVHCTLTLASALHSLPAQLHTGTRLKCIHTSRLRTFTCTSTHSGSRPHRTISATLPPPGPPKTHLHTAQSVEDWVSGQPWCTVGASTHDDVIGNRPGPRGPDPAAIASTHGANRSGAGSVYRRNPYTRPRPGPLVALPSRGRAVSPRRRHRSVHRDSISGCAPQRHHRPPFQRPDP